MCQQWFSVIGLALDVMGFLLIVFEWQHMFKVYNQEEKAKVEEGYDRSRAVATGEQYSDPAMTDYSYWKHFERAINFHAKYRTKLFYSGVAMIVLGFFGQILGNWPGGLLFLGIKSC